MDRNLRGILRNHLEDVEDRPGVDREVAAILRRARGVQLAREALAAAGGPRGAVAERLAAPEAPAAPEPVIDPVEAAARRARARDARRRAVAHQRRAADRAHRAHANGPVVPDGVAPAPVAAPVAAPNEFVVPVVDDLFVMRMMNDVRERPPRRAAVAGRNLFDGERARGRVPPETHQQMVARRRLETVMRHRARAERHMRHREGNRARAIDALGEADLAQERRELMERRLRQIEHVIDEIRRQLVDFRAQEEEAQAEADRLGVVARPDDHPDAEQLQNRAQWNRHWARAAANGDDEARMLLIQNNEHLVQDIMLRNNPPDARRRRPLNGNTGVIVLGEGSDDEEIPVVDLEQQEAMTAGNGILKFTVNFKVAVPCNVPMPPFCDHRGAGQIYAPAFGTDYLGWNSNQVREWAMMFLYREEFGQKILDLGIDGKQLHKIADKTLSYAHEFPPMNWHTFQVNAAALRNYFFGYDLHHNDNDETARRREMEMIRRLMGDHLGDAAIMRFLQPLE